MSADRELLELAAKAEGIGRDVSQWVDGRGFFLAAGDGSGYWNPLADDGDALRLAVKLEMDVLMFADGVQVWSSTGDRATEDAGDDTYAATRRAIVRAAAAIGERA